MPVFKSLHKSLHKTVSPILYKTGLYQRSWQRHNRITPFTFVVFYHRVVADQPADGFDIENGISAADFEKQMRFLMKHFEPVKASQAQHVASDKIQFAVTLDDGYIDNYHVAAPILKKLGIPAAFYVVSDFVGTDRLFWWEQVADIMHTSKQPELMIADILPDVSPSASLPLTTSAQRDFAYGQLCTIIRNGRHVDIDAHLKRISEYFAVPVRQEGRQYGLMDWSHLDDLNQQGFEIGGHTASHCNVVSADETMLKHELIDSVKVLEDRLSSPVESFAYPYGLFERSSTAVADVLAQTNCKAAFTIEQGVVNAALPAYELPRSKLNRAYDFACGFNVQDTLMSAR